MKLSGTYTFEAPRDVVWSALLDPEVLAKTMPGCEKLDKVGENEYKGALKIRVGPVQGQFEGSVTLSDLNPPEGYSLEVDGKGPAGFMKGKGQVRLEAQDNSTLMHYEGEAQVGGRIASVGQRLLDTSAKALTRQSLDSLHEQIKARRQAEGSAEPPPEVAAPSQTQFAAAVTKGILQELIPPEQRPWVIGGGLVLLAIVIFVLIRAFGG